ncbi:hypothetical protein, partial [Moorena sp. SIO4E2]|uniref:hypothetical protein n=1 Tax=Moorena sp. SIO4E2 TaxID=2607826 RepID=UPI00257DCAA8
SNTPSVCAVQGSNAILISNGTCSISALQAGSDSYYAAEPLEFLFEVNLMPQGGRVSIFIPLVNR